MKDKVINEIVADCVKILSPQDCSKVKTIIQEKLYTYELKQQVTDLVPYNINKNIVDTYLASRIVEGLSRITIKNYFYTLNMFANHIQKDILKVDSMDIRMYIAKRKKEVDKNGKIKILKDTTIATTMSTLRAFYEWLRREEYIVKNPMDKIKAIKVDKHLRKPLSPEEMELLRCACKTLREKAIVEVFYSSGCRLDEIYKLNKSDINWHTGEVIVFGKSRVERKVRISERARVHLRNYLKSRNDNIPALFVTDRKINNGEVGRLGRRTYERIISNLGEKAGINRPVFCHILRHTYATDLLIRSNGALPIVQKALGHSSPSTTMLYSKLNDTEVMSMHEKCIV